MAIIDSRSAHVEKRQRVDLLDLKEQREGEAHIFFKSKLVRAKMFFANPEPVKYMRLNHFLKVDTPPDVVLADLSKAFKNHERLAKAGDIFANVTAPQDDLEKVIEAFTKEDSTGSSIERGVAALMAFHSRAVPEEPPGEVLVPAVPNTELNLFAPLRFTDHVKRYLLASDVDSFKNSFLDAVTLREQVVNAERLLGQGEFQAANVGTEIIKDMQQATHYPPKLHDLKPNAEDIAGLVKDLLAHIVLKKSEAVATTTS